MHGYHQGNPHQALGHVASNLGFPAPATSFPVISLEQEASESRGVDGCSGRTPPGRKECRAADMTQWVKVLTTQAW